MKNLRNELKLLQSKVKLNAIRIFKTPDVKVEVSIIQNISNIYPISIQINSIVFRASKEIYRNEAKVDLVSKSDVNNYKKNINKLIELIYKDMKTNTIR